MIWPNVTLAQKLIPKKLASGWGYVDRNTSQTVFQGLEVAEPFIGKFAKVKKNGKWGLIDENLNVVIPFEQYHITALTTSIFSCAQENKIWLHGMPKKSMGCCFQDAALLKGSNHILVLADKNRNYGLMDTLGNTILPFEFCGPPIHLQDQLLLPKKYGDQIRYGLYSKTGEQLIPNDYFQISLWRKRFFKCTKLDGSSTLMDEFGKTVINQDPKYLNYLGDDFIISKKEGVEEVLVRKTQESHRIVRPYRHKEGIVTGTDEQKNYLILFADGHLIKLPPNQSLSKKAFNKLLIREYDPATRVSTYGFLNLKGEVLIPPQYHQVWSWNERWAVVKLEAKNNKAALVSTETGEVLLPPVYDQIQFYHHDFLQVSKDQQSSFLTPELEPITTELPSTFDSTATRYYALSKKEWPHHIPNKTELIQQHGVNPNTLQIIPLEVKLAKKLTDTSGASVVSIHYQNKAGLMDTLGKALTPIIYNRMEAYQSNMATAYLSDTIDHEIKEIMGVISTTGQPIIPFIYDHISFIDANRFLVKKYGLQGVISRDGEVIIPLKYENVFNFKSGYYYLRRFGKTGVAKADGTIIIPVKYDQIDPQLTPNGGFKATLDKTTIYFDTTGKSY